MSKTSALTKTKKLLKYTVLASSLMLALNSTSALADEVSKTSSQKPNIVFILLDDVGFADLGCYGSEILTPNIDELAANGISYNRFENASMSAPTRAAFITGRNPATVNFAELPPMKKDNPPSKDVPLGAGPSTSGELPTNAQTIAEALKDVGYDTYIYGKWHLSPIYPTAHERELQFWPNQKGFNHFYGFLSGHSDQYHPDLVENNTVLPKPNKVGYHLSEDLVDHAIEAFDPNDKQAKFMYLAFGAAHSPLQVPKKYIDMYKGVYKDGWDELRKTRFAKQKEIGIIPEDTVLTPRLYGDAAWDSLTAQEKRVYARFMETYAGFITHTDEQIGRFIQYLKDTGQYENTMIVLAADNGPAAEAGAKGGFFSAYLDKTSVAEMDKNLDLAGTDKTYMLYQRPWAYAGATPFQRYKLWPQAGGIRAPLIISYPEMTDAYKGEVREQYVNIVDLAPTMLDVAGTAFADEIDGVKQIEVAGKSIVPTFSDPNAKTRDVQYFELRGNRAITVGDYKAIAQTKSDSDPNNDRWWLYNEKEDFSQSHDLSKEMPTKLKEMEKIWWQEANKYSTIPLVTPNDFLHKMNQMDDAFEGK